MFIKKLVIGLSFLVFGMHCFGQDTLYNNFTNKWKADSLGIGGFRQKAIIRDSTERIYLINGFNVIKLKKKEIVSMLGTPKFEGQINNAIPFISSIFWTVNLRRRSRTIHYLINKSTPKNGDVVNTYLQIEIRNHRAHEVTFVIY